MEDHVEVALTPIEVEALLSVLWEIGIVEPSPLADVMEKLAAMAHQ